MLAVIKTGGKQYLVKPGLTLDIEKIEGDAGASVNFDEILLVTDPEGTDVKVGAPVVAGAKVPATIVEQGRDKKVSVVKYKRKVRYRRVVGHRQHFTKVKIGEISA